jgi:hypothetical protein
MVLALAACGGPSESDIQATVQAAVQSTAQAQQVAASVKATQEAETACGSEALNTYADSIDTELNAFEQQALLVSSTPRVSLGVPLQRLLDIQTETNKLHVPGCMKDFQTRVIKMMQLHQAGYQNFAAQGDDTVTSTTIQMAQQALADVKRDLATVRTGTVPPSSTLEPITK